MSESMRNLINKVMVTEDEMILRTKAAEKAKETIEILLNFLEPQDDFDRDIDDKPNISSDWGSPSERGNPYERTLKYIEILNADLQAFNTYKKWAKDTKITDRYDTTDRSALDLILNAQNGIKEAIQNYLYYQRKPHGAKFLSHEDGWNRFRSFLIQHLKSMHKAFELLLGNRDGFEKMLGKVFDR